MDSKFALSVFLVLLVTWEVHAAVNCTATGAGRFADPADTTCQNYTLCVYVSASDSYLSYNYVCPTTSLFNPTTSTCTTSTSYVCNASSSNSTTTPCTSEGFFADPTSINCSSYILCISVNQTYEVITFTCPDGTFYDSTTTLCLSTVTCSIPFTCSAVGRFANSTDTSCKTYNLCVLSTNGTYLQYPQTCPSISFFNPNSRICTTSYTCPTTLFIQTQTT